MEGAETLRRIDWYRAAFGSEQGIFLKVSSSSVVKKAITCASSDLGMSLFSSKKAEIKHRSFAVLHGWVVELAFPKQVFTQLKAPSRSTTKSHFKLFCFIGSTFTGEETLRAEGIQTL